MTSELESSLGASSSVTLPSSPTALVPVGQIVPPVSLTSDEIADLQQKAASVIEEIRGANGSKELALIDSITSVGLQSQRRAGGELELLRVRVSELVGSDKGGASARVAGDLGDLRLALNRIDPREVGKESLLRRGIGLLPFGKNQLLHILETIAVRYEPVANQVGMIETRLREGRMLLNRDNIELRKLYEQVEAQQAAVQKNCYLAELLLQRLDALASETDDPAKHNRLQEATFDVATRVQDLRLMAETNQQLFIGIELTRQNNTRLGHAVDRAVTLVGNVVMVGLAIQSALMRQRRVLEATQATREFLGDLIVANAGAIKQHTLEIGDIYTSPVIAIEKIERAHRDLLDAMDQADRLRDEGTAAARENAARLSRLTEVLDRRLLSSGNDITPALEA